MYGLYVSLFKLNVMPKRSKSFKADFYVAGKGNVFKYFDNIFVHSIYLLTIDISPYENSSSLYKRQYFLLIGFAKKHKIKTTTSSHTSAPSKISITSKQLSVCLFFHVSLLLNRKDLRQCSINLVLSLIWYYHLICCDVVLQTVKPCQEWFL